MPSALPHFFSVLPSQGPSTELWAYTATHLRGRPHAEDGKPAPESATVTPPGASASLQAQTQQQEQLQSASTAGKQFGLLFLGGSRATGTQEPTERPSPAQ